MPKSSGRALKAAATIRRLRKAKGLSVEKLADAAGVNPRHLYRIEAGQVRSPGIELLEKVARALDCSVSDLLEG
jgi:transcriptional regulator with XRE-family HTH domain